MRLARSASVHVLQALLEAAIVASLVVVLIAGTAFAAKGGGGNAGTGGGKHGGGGSAGTGTISVPIMVVDNDANGAPNWGDFVTFNVSTTATTEPWVHLQCYQNGTLVASGWDGYFVGSLTTRNFGLYSPQWSGGAASCTASLTTPTWAVLATTTFAVGA